MLSKPVSQITFTLCLLSFSLTHFSVPAAATTVGTFYSEPVHIRLDGKTLIAPSTILIQPSQFDRYALSIQFTDDFKVLAAHDSWKDKLKDKIISSDDSLLSSLVCDQAFLFKGVRQPKTVFKLMKTRPGNATQFILSPQTTACELTLRHGKLSQKVQLRAAPASFAYLNSISTEAQSCIQIERQGKNALLDAFSSINNGQTTCTYPLQSIENLENKIDGLQGKMATLLGEQLSPEFLALKNAYAPLDFSKAPKLDAILISALVFRADYSGVLISRALEYHAKRGTQVRILISDVISLIKDKALFDRLMTSSPNIKVQLYEWNDVSGAGEGTFVSPLHRVMHSKLFITLSKTDRSLNTLIHGGRNIHDGFALKKAVQNNNKLLPYVNYGDNLDESWASWRDFELKIQEPNFVDAVAEHFMHLWNRDAKINAVAPLKKIETTQKLNEDHTLSFVSSVNLNHRSFIHDIEDGILIYSPAYTHKLLDVVASYGDSTRLVTHAVKTVWWRKMVVDVLKDEF